MIIDRAVMGLISTQAEDGYIGTYKDEASSGHLGCMGKKICITRTDRILPADGDPGGTQVGH